MEKKDAVYVINIQILLIITNIGGFAKNVDWHSTRYIKEGIKMCTKNVKISIRIPVELCRSIEKIDNLTKSQVVTKALNFWFDKKEIDDNRQKPCKNKFIRATSDETRCLAAYGTDPYYRCGLVRGHDGPHIFFCRSTDCLGFLFPHTPSNPHPCRKNRKRDER